jgi:nucleotide-binding universal stress UspA family protein
MAAVLKPGWSKPSTILFASEIPANQKAFAFALAQAQEFGSDLILFHAYDTLVVAASETSGIRYYDYAAAARSEKQHLEPLAQRVRDAGLRCEVVVRPGLPADEILAFTREREIDRIVMGTHSPGPIGKLLVGSVAEAVLRTASSPVYIIGPDVVDGSYRNFATRTILCAVSLHEASTIVAAFAAELRRSMARASSCSTSSALRIARSSSPAVRSMRSKRACSRWFPPNLQGQVAIQTIVVPGDPTEELLYQSHCAARRPDRPRRAGCIGFCRHHPPWCGLQNSGPHPVPGHHAFAGGSRSMRLQV